MLVPECSGFFFFLLLMDIVLLFCSTKQVQQCPFHFGVFLKQKLIVTHAKIYYLNRRAQMEEAVTRSCACLMVVEL